MISSYDSIPRRLLVPDAQKEMRLRVGKHHEYIDRQESLDKFISAARDAPWIAVDTEFERVRTFYPRLCLIQLAIPTTSACIDPLADLDLQGLRKILCDSAAIKIFHAARQDLEVLQHALGIVPNHLFDTQIAAAMGGHGDQIGYAQIVKELCGVELSKAFTRTPWCRRPLSQEEILYALDDVEYLDDLYAALKANLSAMGRIEWLEEDCAMLIADDYSENEAAVEKVLRACSAMDRTSQSVAHALAQWREETAKRRDRPREWLLSTAAIVSLAHERPATCQALSRIAELQPGTVKHRGDEILSAIQTGEKNAPSFNPVKRPTRPDPKTKALGNEMWRVLGELCANADLPTSCVARRDEIRALAAGTPSDRLMSGWRREFAGNQLMQMTRAARD